MAEGGFEKLNIGETDCAVIAGMGGGLIISILEKGKDIIVPGYELILSPQAQAEAEAAAIRNIAEAVADRGADPVNYLLAVKYIETLKEVAGGQDNKTVYLPYEATNMLGSLGGIKDMFAK